MTMAVSLRLPHALVPYARGSATLAVEEPCATVGEALASVRTRWPAVTDRILTEQGVVRQHVNVFVGDESIRFLDGLSTPLADGDSITIVAAVSGG
jgi:molybdopterin synthase sulfur carrier subunit